MLLREFRFPSIRWVLTLFQELGGEAKIEMLMSCGVFWQAGDKIIIWFSYCQGVAFDGLLGGKGKWNLSVQHVLNFRIYDKKCEN